MKATSKTKPADKFTNLVAGKILSETQYYKVLQVKGDKVQLENDQKEKIVVDRNYIEKCLTLSDFYTSEKTVTKTEAAEMLVRKSSVAMTISFNKKVNATNVIANIMDAFAESKISNIKSAVTKAVSDAIEGEERVITGYHNGNVNELGRLMFVDMELENDPAKDYDTRIRLVDPRTINWMVIEGVKYTVK